MALEKTECNKLSLCRKLILAPRINDVVRGCRGVSADTAMRLARYFGGDARSGLNLQAAYDLRIAQLSVGERIEREVKPAAA